MAKKDNASQAPAKKKKNAAEAKPFTEAARLKVKYNEEQYRKSKGLIALQIKALIARDMFDTAAYFRVMNPRNPSFVKAMEIINDDLEYNRLLQPKS